MGGNRPRLAWLIVLALLAALGFVAYREHRERALREAAELQAGVDASRVLSVTFERTGALRAARLRGEIQSRGACTSAYLFTDGQQTVAPYTVDYLVDLAKIGRGSFRWNARDRVMFVDLPGVTVEPPAIDMGRARSRQTGAFISRACGLAMGQQIAKQLSGAAWVHARSPDYVARARESARAVVAQLVAAPLAAAGLGKVDVRVRLPDDPRPVGDERWDRSRSIDEVLADPRYEP